MKGLKRIKSKIKSVSHLEKVTEAMEKVAAVKMKKIGNLALKSRRYSYQALKILADLKYKTEPLLHPFLQDGDYSKSNKIGLILLTSDKGLCGNFNSRIFTLIEGFIKDARDEGKDAEIICIGKKGNNFLKNRCSLKPDFSFVDIGEQIEENDVESIVKLSIDEYSNKKYSKIIIIYNDFISPAVQRPVIKQILPIEPDYIRETLEARGINESYLPYEYVFEPSPEMALSKILLELVKIQIFQALLDSKNSEYASRYSVMKNATEKANEIIDELRLDFNKTRQAAITEEIAEVTSGQL